MPEAEASTQSLGARDLAARFDVWSTPGHSPTAMTPGTMYYELDGGLAVIWEPDQFPHIVGGGVIHDVEKFAREATPITKVDSGNWLR